MRRRGRLSVRASAVAAAVTVATGALVWEATLSGSFQTAPGPSGQPVGATVRVADESLSVTEGPRTTTRDASPLQGPHARRGATSNSMAPAEAQRAGLPVRILWQPKEPVGTVQVRLRLPGDVESDLLPVVDGRVLTACTRAPGGLVSEVWVDSFELWGGPWELTIDEEGVALVARIETPSVARVRVLGSLGDEIQDAVGYPPSPSLMLRMPSSCGAPASALNRGVAADREGLRLGPGTGRSRWLVVAPNHATAWIDVDFRGNLAREVRLARGADVVVRVDGLGGERAGVWLRRSEAGETAGTLEIVGSDGSARFVGVPLGRYTATLETSYAQPPPTASASVDVFGTREAEVVTLRRGETRRQVVRVQQQGGGEITDDFMLVAPATRSSWGDPIELSPVPAPDATRDRVAEFAWSDPRMFALFPRTRWLASIPRVDGMHWMEIPKQRPIEVWVLDAENDATLGDASVWALGIENSELLPIAERPWFPSVLPLEKGERGFHGTVPSGTLLLWARASGFAPHAEFVVAPRPRPIEVRLAPLGSVEIDLSGFDPAVGSLVVRAVGSNDELGADVDTTDARGLARVWLRPGSYQIGVESEKDGSLVGGLGQAFTVRRDAVTRMVWNAGRPK